MSSIEQAIALATTPVPGPGTSAKTRKAFDAMPMAELASVWCALRRVSTRDGTDGTRMVSSDFDSLPHDTPGHPIDCEAISLPELARAWVEQHSKAETDQSRPTRRRNSVSIRSPRPHVQAGRAGCSAQG